MAVNPSAFGPMPQFVNLIGEPAAGDKLFFYIAGTNTKLDTFTDSTGTVANTNPVVLDALGNPPYEIWWTAGSLYKMVWAPSTDTDPPVAAYRTVDNLRGMNDFQTTAVTFDEWLVYGAAATYISGTSFSVTGNQTNTFQIGRRIKTTNTGGAVYSTITNSVFGAVTTVTLRNDSGVIDSGLSAVAYGVLSVTNPSIPVIQTIAFSAYNSITTAMANNVFTKIDFQTENYDIGSTFASSRFTCTVPGLYTFKAVYRPGADALMAVCAIRLNGIQDKQGQVVGPPNAMGADACVDLNLVVGDYVEAFGYQNSGGLQGTTPGSANTWFQGILIAKT